MRKSNIKKHASDDYSVSVNKSGIKVNHIGTVSKYRFIDKLFKKLNKIDSDVNHQIIVPTLFLGMLSIMPLIVIWFKFPIISSSIILLLLSFLTFPTFIELYIKKLVKKASRTVNLKFSSLPEIINLNNRDKVLTKYFDNLSQDDMKIFVDNVQLLNDLNSSKNDMEKLYETLTNNSVLKKDVEKKQKLLALKINQIHEYFDVVLAEIKQSSVDEHFLSVMSKFDELEKTIKTDEQKAKIVHKPDNVELEVESVRKSLTKHS